MMPNILRSLQGMAFFAIAATEAMAAPGGNLDGVSGTIFKVNPEPHSFELLKETEYDPKTDIGRSRFTVYWDDNTRVTKVTEPVSFAGIKGPVIAEFQGIDDKNAKAISEGQPFICRVATLLPGETKVSETTSDQRKVSGWFTPDAGEAPTGGSIEIGGKPVKMSLRRSNARIFTREPLKPADLANGFWSCTIHGAESDGRFVIGNMEVKPLGDPRTTDDPKLPRVLVVGDSVSMNYQEAAVQALKGVANYHRNEGNSFATIFGVMNMELWLGDYKENGLHWDVIQFNHGLHDLKQSYDAATDTFGEYAVPLEDYKKNLEKEIAIMRKTGAKLIWCSTTPVPNDNKATYARRQGAEREFNNAALEVMKRHPEILVTDLQQVVDSSAVFDNWRKGNDVHFYKEEEQSLLGGAVAATLRKALAKPAKKLPVPGEVFEVDGHTAFLILPKNRPADVATPWVWYAPTLPGLPGKVETWMFERFLENGIAIAGVDVGESMGSPSGVAVFSALHNELVKNRGMSPRPCLLARSRGGLMLYNWAAENPNSVSCIAGIYPVGNLASYPGLGRACNAYGLSEDELSAKLPEYNPVARLAPLAKAGVPIMHLHGDSDRIVPIEKNSGLVKERFTKLGGAMTLEVIKGGGHDMSEHWFHSEALVDFVIKHAKETR
jgi:hypothetical protein